MKTKLNKLIDKLILLFVFLLPWQAVWIFDEQQLNGFKWQFGTGEIYATEIILWAILLLYLFNIQYSVFNIKEILNIKYLILKHKLKAGLIFSIWALVAYSGLSIIWAPEKWPAFYNWFHLAEAAAFFFIIIRSKIDRKKILFALVLSAVIQSLIACWQFFGQDIAASKWLGIAAHPVADAGTIVVQGDFGRYLRAYGTFAHPNILGGFLSIGFISAIILYFDNLKNLYPIDRSRRVLLAWSRDQILLISVFLIGTGIFFSFSRSAWLALAAAGIIAFFFAVKAINKGNFVGALKIGILIAVMTAGLLVIYNPLVFSRMDLSQRLEAKSLGQRLDYYGQAKSVISDHWLLGTGLGNYTYSVYQKNLQIPGLPVEPVHNVYVLVLAELGVIGLLGYFVFLIFNIKYSILHINANNTKKYLSNYEFYFLILIFIINFLDHYFWTQYAGVMLFWLVLGLSVKIDSDYEKNN